MSDITSTNCSICKKQCHQLLKLTTDCSHPICSIDCLQTYALESTHSDVYSIYQKRDEVLCKECGEQISEDLIIEAFGGEDELDVQEVVCELCYGNYPITQCKTLINCQHQFCTWCIEEYIEYMVTNNQVDENQLKCPGCGVSIERAQIELLLKERYDKPELLEKFYQFSLQNTLMQNEKFVSCPGKDCRWGFLVFEDTRYIICPRKECGISFCVLCLKDSHLGMNCEQWAEYRKKLKMDDFIQQEFEKYSCQEGIRKCPSCGVPCEKVNGCNFMTCISIKCKGERYFCYICGKMLERLQHYTHFYLEPFGNKCEG